MTKYEIMKNAQSHRKNEKKTHLLNQSLITSHNYSMTSKFYKLINNYCYNKFFPPMYLIVNSYYHCRNCKSNLYGIGHLGSVTCLGIFFRGQLLFLNLDTKKNNFALRVISRKHQPEKCQCRRPRC